MFEKYKRNPQTETQMQVKSNVKKNKRKKTKDGLQAEIKEKMTLIRVASATNPVTADKIPNKPTTEHTTKTFLSIPLAL